MAEFVRFPPRQPDDEIRRALGQRLADKMQILVLKHPVAAIEVEKLLDRLLAELEA